jgi:hypothetical protein
MNRKELHLIVDYCIDVLGEERFYKTCISTKSYEVVLNLVECDLIDRVLKQKGGIA